MREERVRRVRGKRGEEVGVSQETKSTKRTRTTVAELYRKRSWGKGSKPLELERSQVGVGYASLGDRDKFL